MTKGERAVGGLFLVAGFLIISGVFMGAVFGALSVVLGGLKLAINDHAIPSGAKLWQLTSPKFWPVVVATGFMFPLLIGGAMVREEIKKVGWRATMPAFIWPETSAPEPTILARFGRVFHWTFVVAAALALGTGIAVTLSMESYRSSQATAQAEWDRAHPVPGKPGFVMDQIPDEFGGYVSRPVLPAEDFTGLWVGLGAGLVLLLIGRGGRYILAGE